MTLDEEQLSVLMWLVHWHLWRRFGGHPWWDDLLGEARLGAWVALTKLTEPLTCELSTVACKAGLWAACAWLRSKKNDDRERTRKGKPLPEKVRIVPGVVEPEVGDFAGEVVARIAAAAELVDLDPEPGLAALKARLLTRIVLSGEAPGLVAREEGLSTRRCRKLRQEALATLRARWARRDGAGAGAAVADDEPDRDEPRGGGAARGAVPALDAPQEPFHAR